MFNLRWLEEKLQFSEESPEDVQATLLQLTVISIAKSIDTYCLDAEEVYICGGGGHNSLLINQLAEVMSGRKVALTDQLGITIDWVEAFAFAWLAQQAILRKTGNLTSVTGAKESRILGAIYPA